jgi:TorA maturation chaperone TorD
MDSAYEKEMKKHRDLAECRSNLYALLSSIYLQIPESKTLSLHWEPALKLLEFPQKEAEKFLQEIKEGLSLIKDNIFERKFRSEEHLSNLSRDWTRLFRGVNIRGPLPPYESLYRTGKLQDKPAQEICRLFSKMGIRVPEEWHQPLDYIGVEFDFMHLLCTQERGNWEKNQLGLVLEVVEIEKSFLDDHLSLWIPIFCEKMIEQAQEIFFKGIARLTKGFINYDQIWTSYLFRLLQNKGRNGCF